MPTRGFVVSVVVALTTALVLVAGAPATTSYSVKLTGAEVLPVTSTLGTFVGVASGELVATWRAQIVHEPLAAGPTVRITGGRFTVVTVTGRSLRGAVTSGSVSVTDRGRDCTNQTYDVAARLSIGTFVGTLTHHRHGILGRCVVYAATIRGRGVFNA